VVANAEQRSRSDMRDMRVAILLALFLCLLSPIAVADTSVCRASAEVIPDVAIVGQQILYRVRIVRRQDVDKVTWERSLNFPNFRAEWLPGHAEDSQLHHSGMTFVAREEDRALFPMRAGRFEIPEASLRCTIRGRGPNAEYSEVLRVAPVQIRIVEPPASGRPDDFGGAVGPLSVQTSIGSQQIRLGESLAVSVLVRGTANLWDLPAPFHDDAFDAEVFHKQPEIDLEAGEQLYLRRYFRFDLVPREAGVLTIPSMRVPYYDHRKEHYSVSESKAVRISVLPRSSLDAGPNGPALAQRRGLSAEGAAGSPSPANGDVESAGAGSEHADDASFTTLQWGAVAGVGASGLAIALSVLGQRKRRRHAVTREALAEADEAHAEGDWKRENAALSRALYGALAVAAPDLDAPSPAALRERACDSGDRDLIAAADAIDALDRVRFSVEPSAPNDDDARAAIAGLQTRRRRRD
jgi:hypothetical protein